MNQDRWEKSEWKKDTEMKENVRDESEKDRQDRPCRGELESDTGGGGAEAGRNKEKRSTRY